jgi:hypothetical protein
MAENIDEITIEYKDPVSGTLLVQELDKEVLTRGAWTTIMFRYQELNQKTEEFGPIKFRVARYRKRDGQFLPQSKFNISNSDQAKKIVDVLNQWIELDESDK